VGSGILGSDVSFEDRLVPSLEDMARKVEHLKGLNARVVLTSRPVDLLYLKDEDEPRWGLIKAVNPDVLVLSEDNKYSAAEQEELREYCAHVEVLERQASVTTSERIRQMHMHMGEQLGPELGRAIQDQLPELIDDILTRR
jgi:bifunctional ADP-heptose synthase (sugar kinase/adenylyltransferase)